jgi:hypothetical protein
MLSPLARLLHLRGKLRHGRLVPKRIIFFHDSSLWNPGSTATLENRLRYFVCTSREETHEKGISNAGDGCNGCRSDDVRSG